MGAHLSARIERGFLAKVHEMLLLGEGLGPLQVGGLHERPDDVGGDV